MNQEYLLTVITPIKNDLRVKELILSLKNQPEYGLIEFIISFNGAENNFIHDIISLVDSPNFKFLELHYPSIPHAINAAIELASSQKIVIIDSDCVVMAGFLQKMIQGSKDRDIVCGQVRFRGVNYFSKLTAIHRTIIYSHKNNYFYAPNLCINKNVFKECGYFNENLKYGFDAEFSHRVIRKGYSYHFVEDAIVQHECHPVLRHEIRIWFYYGRDRSYRFLAGYFGEKSIKNFVKMLYQPIAFSSKEGLSYNIYVFCYLLVRNLGVFSYLIVK